MGPTDRLRAGTGALSTVTLLTDFGHRDPYVGIMKGVILGICPEARLVDLTHEVSPQQVTEGAYQLARSVRWFPRGTVHLAVVDPGVGGRRRAVVARGARHLYVAPDNGLLSMVEERDGPLQFYEIQRFTLESHSATFHGRDIFAPVAAHLARGVAPREIGPPVDEPVRLEKPLSPCVLLVDRFGNLITSIEEGRPGEVEVHGAVIPVRGSYSDVEPGSLLALWGSDGRLEVSVNQGNAAERLGAGPGTPVTVRRQVIGPSG